MGRWGRGHPIPNFDILFGCNWVVAPQNSTPSEDVPFKDDFLVYHKHIFTKVGIDICVMVWPIVSTNHQQKCLAEVYLLGYEELTQLFSMVENW